MGWHSRGTETERQRKTEEEAAAEVEVIRQDDKYFSPEAPR